jgi:hypothetical protein
VISAVDRVTVSEDGRTLEFSFDEMVRYNGGDSPAGVAVAFKALELALPLLSEDDVLERRELAVETAFAGPGARDAFELVTRAVTGGRYVVDPALANLSIGRARERFVFTLRYRDAGVTLTLRDGFVTDDFIALTRQLSRTAEEEELLTEMKAELAACVMAARAEDVYDVTSAAQA